MDNVNDLTSLANAFKTFKNAYIDLVETVYKTDETKYCISEEMAEDYPFTLSFDEIGIEDWCDKQIEKISAHIQKKEENNGVCSIWIGKCNS